MHIIPQLPIPQQGEYGISALQLRSALAVGAEEDKVLNLRVLRKLGKQTLHRRIFRRGLEVEDEAELEVHARKRAGLQLREVHVYCRELRYYLRQRARTMRDLLTFYTFFSELV